MGQYISTNWSLYNNDQQQLPEIIDEYQSDRQVQVDNTDREIPDCCVGCIPFFTKFGFDF